MTEVCDRLTFCLNCFRQHERESTRCPFCGIEVDRWQEIGYGARLSHALEHPLDDVRMRAIIALGWRAEPEAEAALVECAFAHPTDVTNGLEIVRSLGAIAERHGCRGGLLRLSAEHPARWMRRAAEGALRRFRDRSPAALQAVVSPEAPSRNVSSKSSQ